MSHAPNEETHWKTSDTKIHLDIHARHRRTFRFLLWRSTWPWACCSTSRYLGLTVINAVWCIAVETRRLDRRVQDYPWAPNVLFPPKKKTFSVQLNWCFHILESWKLLRAYNSIFTTLRVAKGLLKDATRRSLPPNWHRFAAYSSICPCSGEKVGTFTQILVVCNLCSE